ncbi:50S ribosomal protein L15 [Planctomycetota bacterium]
MDLKTLRESPSIKPRRKPMRVGRGTGSKGKTCGRGHKGAGARSGHKIRDYYEGGQMPLQRRFPKRGFSNAKFGVRYAILNVSQLNRFEDGAEITPATLKQSGLLKQQLDGVKVLGDGDLERKDLKVTAHKFSESARKKLEQAGCNVTVIKPRRFRRGSGRREDASGGETETDAKKG